MNITKSCTCPKCNGTGKLPEFSHIANGDCFMCSGTGKFDYKAFTGPNRQLRLDVFKRDGGFWYAQFRCVTWRPYTLTQEDGTQIKGKEWGRDVFYQEIQDVNEARQLWKTAGAVNNVWED